MVVILRILRCGSASLRTRSPIGVPLTALHPRDFRPQGSAPGQVSWDAAAIFARWALPTPACPSPVTAPHAPAVVPANLMPKAAREQSDINILGIMPW